MPFETLILFCHFLKRYHWDLLSEEIALPWESTFLKSISVVKPPSCFLLVIGAPVLALLAICSLSKALHSGPSSIKLLSTTKPQQLHTSSALCSSCVNSIDPHSGHTVSKLLFIFHLILYNSTILLISLLFHYYFHCYFHYFEI